MFPEVSLHRGMVLDIADDVTQELLGTGRTAAHAPASRLSSRPHTLQPCPRVLPASRRRLLREDEGLQAEDRLFEEFRAYWRHNTNVSDPGSQGLSLCMLYYVALCYNTVTCVLLPVEEGFEGDTGEHPAIELLHGRATTQRLIGLVV